MGDSARVDEVRDPRWLLAWALLAGNVGLLALNWGLARGTQMASPEYWVALAVETLSAGTVGVLVVRRQPGNVVGWLLLLHGFLVAGTLGFQPVADTQVERVLTQVLLGGWVLLYLSLALIGYVFPDGRFLSRRWRWWTIGWLLGYAAFMVSASSDQQGFAQAFPGVAAPLPRLPQPLAGGLGMLGLLSVLASLVGAVVSARQRLRKSTGQVRVQMLWFVWAALSIAAALLTCWVDYAVNGTSTSLTFFAVVVFGSTLPIAIGVAILRTNLFDIELVLSRTLTYGVLTALVIGVYAGTLEVVQRVFASTAAGGLLAVGIVAALIQPVHGRVRLRVERWVYGDRSDPTAALRRMTARVEGTTEPGDVIGALSESIADALKVDRVWVELARQAAPVESDPATVRIALTHRSERLGDLLVAVPSGRQLSPADIRLLHDLARHAAVVVAAVQLADDLQHSRAGLVAAREEERRRLRRDLHDGLGPSLAAIVLKLNAARTRHDETSRTRLLAEASEETRDAIGEVRRLVDDLRPPAIDEVGLLGSIRQRAATLSSPGSGELHIDVSGPAALPALPAAVEVAAYRIATEALTNVAVSYTHLTLPTN
jgi:signal transduction histidine kinase